MRTQAYKYELIKAQAFEVSGADTAAGRGVSVPLATSCYPPLKIKPAVIRGSGPPFQGGKGLATPGVGSVIKCCMNLLNCAVGEAGADGLQVCNWACWGGECGHLPVHVQSPSWKVTQLLHSL